MAPLIPTGITVKRGWKESVDHALLFGCETADEESVTCMHKDTYVKRDHALQSSKLLEDWSMSLRVWLHMSLVKALKNTSSLYIIVIPYARHAQASGWTISMFVIIPHYSIIQLPISEGSIN